MTQPSAATLTDQQLTQLYQRANNETPPAKPQALATRRIFAAMRAAYELGAGSPAPAGAAQGDSYEQLWNAFSRVDSAVIGLLPTFEVVQEGGIEAVTENLVRAIEKAGQALQALAPNAPAPASELPDVAFGLRLQNDTAKRLAVAISHLKEQPTVIGGFFGGTTYCIGLAFKDSTHAFHLGAQLGLGTAPGYGDVGFDRYPGKVGGILVFSDARVAQA